MEDKKFPQRSLKQNKAIHVWFAELEEEMMAKGIEFHDIVPNNIEIPITATYLKSVFQAIGKKMFGKQHTSILTTKELGQVGEVYEKWIANATGGNVDLLFPSKEELENAKVYSKKSKNK